MRLIRVSPLIFVIGFCVAVTSPGQAATAAHAASATFTGLLPVSPGQTVVVSQGNGPNAWDHIGSQQYAFDFVVGQQNFVINAAQGGTIIGLNDTSSIQCGGLNWESSPVNQELAGCWTHANFVLIKDDDGITASLYMHLLQGSACSAEFCVNIGEHVSQGDPLARAGTTGWSTGTHLHFQAESIPAPQQDPYTGWWFTNSLPAHFTNPEVLAQDSNGVPQTGQRFKLTGPGTATPSATAGPVTASLPVVSCPTSLGIDHPAVSLPQSRPAAVPQALAADLSVYADNQGVMELLGPKGWNCTAAIGADGSGGVTIYPAGAGPSSPVAITGSETSACVGCTLSQACRLFPGAATALRSALGQACPGQPPTAETVTPIAAGIVAFEDPPGVKGDGQPSGGQYPADGVMTYHPSAPDGSWQETCTLPASEKNVCTTVLNTFVSWYGQR